MIIIHALAPGLLVAPGGRSCGRLEGLASPLWPRENFGSILMFDRTTARPESRRLIMAIALPQTVKRILEDKAYGHVITFDAAGKPQVTMGWVGVDGDEVVFNTAEGRLKPKNLGRDPRIVVSVQDRNDPQAYMVFHGTASLTEAGADAHIDKLAKRFLGADK